MAAIDSMELAHDRGFARRVKYFMTKAALAIYPEGPNPNKSQRVTYATTVLDGSASVFEMTVAVLTNATVAAAGVAATDADIEFTVNSFWDAFSRVESN